MRNLFFTLLFAGFAAISYAADGNAEISGKVTLENPFTTLATPDVSAIVELENLDNPNLSYAYPYNGAYNLEVPAGRYRLKISQHRYSPYITEIDLSEGKQVLPPVELKLRALSGTIAEDYEADRDYIVLANDKFVVESGYSFTIGEYSLLNAGSVEFKEAE